MFAHPYLFIYLFSTSTQDLAFVVGGGFSCWLISAMSLNSFESIVSVLHLPEPGGSEEEAEEVKRICLIPPIEKMDSFPNTLVAVKKLSSPQTASTR